MPPFCHSSVAPGLSLVLLQTSFVHMAENLNQAATLKCSTRSEAAAPISVSVCFVYMGVYMSVCVCMSVMLGQHKQFFCCGIAFSSQSQLEVAGPPFLLPHTFSVSALTSPGTYKKIRGADQSLSTTITCPHTGL